MEGKRLYYTWKQIVPEDNDILHIRSIHPLQQRLVGEIVRFAERYTSISRIIIFGSSTYPCCRERSDLDIYIEGEFNTFDLYANTPSRDVPLDIWREHDVNDKLFKEILSDGVVVYDVKGAKWAEQSLSKSTCC